MSTLHYRIDESTRLHTQMRAMKHDLLFLEESLEKIKDNPRKFSEEKAMYEREHSNCANICINLSSKLRVLNGA